MKGIINKNIAILAELAKCPYIKRLKAIKNFRSIEERELYIENHKKTHFNILKFEYNIKYIVPNSDNEDILNKDEFERYVKLNKFFKPNYELIIYYTQFENLPTYFDLIKWLQDYYNIYIDIETLFSNKIYFKYKVKLLVNNKLVVNKFEDEYIDSTSALNDGISYSLNLLINKNIL